MQVDRLFDWQPVPNAPIQESLASQKENVRAQFEQRLQQTMLNLNEQGAARTACLSALRSEA